jgi:hypothetical protein
MATLKDYFGNAIVLRKFVLDYDIKMFVETGTGIGDTVDFVNGCIPIIYSIEIIPEIANKAQNRFAYHDSIEIVNAESVDGLKKIVEPDNAGTLYFLDAHFPGADFGYAKYDSEKNKDKRIPLQKEIETIVKLRGEAIKNDCFIIDDLRVYEDGDYGDGNWPLRKELGGEGIEFIYDAFAETHYIEKDYRFQGFIVLTPIK